MTLDIDQTARLLNVSRGYVFRLVGEGRLGADGDLLDRTMVLAFRRERDARRRSKCRAF